MLPCRYPQPACHILRAYFRHWLRLQLLVSLGYSLRSPHVPAESRKVRNVSHEPQTKALQSRESKENVPVCYMYVCEYHMGIAVWAVHDINSHVVLPMASAQGAQGSLGAFWTGAQTPPCFKQSKIVHCQSFKLFHRNRYHTTMIL